MKTKLLKAGVKRIVHVLAPMLQANLQDGKQRSIIGVRPFENPETLEVYRHAEILGPCSLMHTPEQPLPGTNGRGICYMVTTAAIRVWVDPDDSKCVMPCTKQRKRVLPTNKKAMAKSYKFAKATAA